MRLKTFSAPSMAEAMKMVKEHFGEDAIIVSSQKGDGGLGVRVTAAIEPRDDDYDDDWDAFGEEDAIDPFDAISEALAHHGVPPDLMDKILRTASGIEIEDANLALAGAFDQHFRFAPLPAATSGRSIVLVGMPGAGKTVTTAKLATRAIMAKEKVHVITTDTVRAGGFAQLEAFTRLLGLRLMSADTPEQLRDTVTACPIGEQIIVDCAGGNPFDDRDFQKQADLLSAIDAEVALVMAAGGDPLEAGEIAEAYRDMGARRLVVTRIDVARRLGAVLNAAAVGRLTLSEVGVGANVADGLKPINPVSLARLLLPQETEEVQAAPAYAAAARGAM